MSAFEIRNLEYDRTVREFLTTMPAFGLLGLSIDRLTPGEADISMIIKEGITFDGLHVQGGIVGALLDIAGGAAAFTLAPEGHALATLGFETHHLGPAVGDRLLAVGKVVKPGRNQSLSLVEIFAEKQGKRSLCATGHVTARWIALPG